MNRIVSALMKLGIKPVSHGDFKVRACKDVDNFLHEKERREDEALQADIKFDTWNIDL